MSDWGVHTTAIHAGEAEGVADVAPPIHVSSSFRFSSAEEAAQAFEMEDRYIYTRWNNPTINHLEAKVAALEGGESALAAASGMAAISTAVLTAVQVGDHVVASTGLYGGTRHFLRETLPRYGVAVSFATAADVSAFESALRPNTRLIYLESPNNPALELNDIAAIVSLAQARGVMTMIDNTFATPINQKPLAMGVDVVVHSATKYFCGHGDAIGGVIVGPQAFIERARKETLRHFGGNISPFNAWLIARGMQTLPLRVVRHNENALRLAEWLANDPRVAWVRYPWHPSHPQYDLARRQMPGGGGGVVVFEVKGGVQAGMHLLDRVRLCTQAASLGDTHTLISHPASTMLAHVPPEVRRAGGVSDGLIRLAVGLEDVEDIIADLDQALG